MGWLNMIGYLVIAYIVFFFGWAYFSINKFNNNLLKSLTELLNGQLESSKLSNVAMINFVYESRKFQFVYPCGNIRVQNPPAYLITPTGTNFTLSMIGKVGDSIGVLVENIYAFVTVPGCEELDKQTLPNLFENTRVYTNDVKKARAILADNEVLELLKSSKNAASSVKNSSSLPIFFSIHIKNGDIISIPNMRSLNANSTLIKEYLSRMVVLANKISSLS